MMTIKILAQTRHTTNCSWLWMISGPMLLLLSTALAGDVFYIQSRITEGGGPAPAYLCPDPPYKELTGTWYEPGSGSRSSQDPWPGPGSRFGTSTACSFRLTPTNLLAGATYQLETTHIGTSCSSDLMVNVSCDVATMSVATTDAFKSAYAHVWKAIGRFKMPPVAVRPTITFTYASGNVGGTTRWYVDAFRFVDVSDPCVDALPQLDTVTGPLAEGQTFVDASGIHSNAVAVHVYADNVEIGALAEGVVEGVNRVPLTVPLVKNQIITASQNDATGIQSCRPAVGQPVGGGANPQIRVCVNIRQNLSLTGPIGANGGTVSPTLKFLGATNVVGGSLGQAPMGGKLVTPGSCWQTISFMRGTDPNNPVDPSFAWSNSDGTNAIKGDFGVLESIDFSIEDLGDSGPFRIYIDNIMNGSTMIQDFESCTNGQRNVVFLNPYFAGNTAQYLLTAPDICEVTNEYADASINSELISFQFKKLIPAAWVRLISQGTVTTNPMVDLRLPISFRVLALPVGQTIASIPVTATGPTNQIVGSGSSVTLSTAAAGDGPLTYRWFKGGVELSGETVESLTIPGITYDQGGSYAVEITGLCNIITNTAIVTVVPPPAFDMYVYDAVNNTFSAVFNTMAGLTYLIEYKDNLTNASWTPLQTMNGDGTPTYFTDPLTNPPSTRFYRIRTQ